MERCEAMCYMTDLRSVDGSCRMLSPAECASGQFYESDLLGNRSACALLSGGCGTSWNCSSSVICRSQVHFDAPEASEACGPLCHMTNTLVSGLSCRDLSLAQCSSEQFYESDQEGERRRCVLALQGCVADPRAACPASRPLCGAQVPVASGSEPCRECAATCLTFCDKINTRPMGHSDGPCHVSIAPMASQEPQGLLPQPVGDRRSAARAPVGPARNASAASFMRRTAGATEGSAACRARRAAAMPAPCAPPGAPSARASRRRGACRGPCTWRTWPRSPPAPPSAAWRTAARRAPRWASPSSAQR